MVEQYCSINVFDNDATQFRVAPDVPQVPRGRLQALAVTVDAVSPLDSDDHKDTQVGEFVKFVNRYDGSRFAIVHDRCVQEGSVLPIINSRKIAVRMDLLRTKAVNGKSTGPVRRHPHIAIQECSADEECGPF